MNSAEFFASSTAAALETAQPVEFDKARDLCERLAVRLEEQYSEFFFVAVDELINNGRAVISARYAHRGLEAVVNL